MRPNETPKGYWRALYQKPVSNDDDTVVQNVKGVLVATDQRIAFLREVGLMSKTLNLLLSLDFERIRGSSVSGRFTKLLVLNVDTSAGLKNYRLSSIEETEQGTLRGVGNVNPDIMRTHLNDMISSRLIHLENEKKRGRVQYVLDFSFLKAEMEKGGIVVQTIKCPNCSANVALPSAGNSMKCEYCGSTIHAHDVFDKMKGLIGSI